VRIAVVIDPLPADLTPERMVVLPGDAGLRIEDERAVDVFGGKAEKALAVRASLVGKQLGRAHKKERTPVCRRGIMQVEDDGEAFLCGEAEELLLRRGDLGINRCLIPIAVVIARISLLAPVARGNAINVLNGYDKNLRCLAESRRIGIVAKKPLDESPRHPRGTALPGMLSGVDPDGGFFLSARRAESQPAHGPILAGAGQLEDTRQLRSRFDGVGK